MVRRAVRAHVACLLLTAGLLLPVAARAQEVGVEPEEAVWGTARILRIELLGTDGTSFEDLRHLVVVREGEPLSRRDIRRSVQRLYRTGRFANVEAYAEDRVGGVHLRFVLVPRKLLREVRVEGAPFLAGREPAALTDLAPGMDYADDLIEHGMLRLREVLARAGYERAEVQTAVDAGDDSVALHFHVTPHQPTRIARLRFSGERGDRAIVEAFALSRGDVLDLDRLERELDTLRDRYVKEGYFRAKVGRPRIERVSENAVVVEIPLAAGPRFTLAFRGNHSFGDLQLREVLAYTGEERLDAAMAEDLAARLVRAYRKAGYFDARVVPAEVLSPDGRSARLTFHVDEGKPLVVHRIVLRGARAMGEKTVRGWLKEEFSGVRPPNPPIASPRRGEVDAAYGKLRSAAFRELRPEEILDEEIYQEVIAGLLARYRDEGFLEARIEGPFVTVDERTRLATVELRVEEGRRTWIRAVEFMGAEVLSPAQLASATVREGRPLSERRVSDHRVELQGRYARQGYLYAQVVAEIERPPSDPEGAIVRFVVHEGPKVRVGEILVQGTRRTQPWAIRQTMGIAEGDVLTSDRIAAAQQDLMRMGLFRAVSVRPLDPDLPEPVKDLVVEVSERNSRSLEVGGGISIADGPRAFAEYHDRNILGRNLQLVLRGRVNHQIFREDVREMPIEDGIERDLQAGLRFPRIWGIGLPIGWHFDLTHQRDIRISYNLYRNSALTGFEFPLAPWLQGTLRFELESNEIEHSSRFDALYGTLSRIDLERLRFPDGTVLLGSVRPGVFLDLRDDVAYPRKGFTARMETDFARNLGGSTVVDFVKLAGTLTGYVPLWERSVLVLSGSGGKVFHLQDESVTIPPTRFYLGGAGSLRGWAEDTVVPQDRRAALRKELADCRALLFRSGCAQQARFLDAGRAVPSEGGDLYVLARVELRFPLYGNLMGGLFLDAGNLWLEMPETIDLAHLRSAAGFGLRYATPVGPVVFDLGFNLAPDRTIGESPVGAHFSVGLF